MSTRENISNDFEKNMFVFSLIIQRYLDDICIVIAEPLNVYKNVDPSKWNLKTIDKLIDVANQSK